MSSAFETLRRDFGGDIIEPGAAEYESASRSVLASGSPAHVLRPTSVEDVQAGVRFTASAGSTRASRQRRLRKLPRVATEEDVAAIYPTETYERLAAVKRQYDPGNLFARNHNVRPQYALAGLIHLLPGDTTRCHRD